MSTVDISGLDKAVLLVMLFTKAQPPTGIAEVNNSASDILTPEEAREIFANPSAANPYVGQPYKLDYVKGRKLRIDLGGDTVDTEQYDRHNGAGTVQWIVDALREGKAIDVEQDLGGDLSAHVTVLSNGWSSRFLEVHEPGGTSYYID